MTSCATSDSPLLALNCAEDRIQVVLGSGGTVLFAEEIRCPGQSIRYLPTTLERGLAVAGIVPGQLAGIACVRGPGSFTGLRIAHAAMYGLSRPHAIPMAGLELHSVLAAQNTPLVEGELWILTYARRNQVYMQGFAQGHPLGAIAPVNVNAAQDLLTARMHPVTLCGSGLRCNPSLTVLPNQRILPEALDRPTPTVLLQQAATAAFSTQPPAPLYLRKSDAEDNLDAIAAARGIPPEQARAQIFDFD